MSQRMTNPAKWLGYPGESGWHGYSPFHQSGCALDGLLRVQGFYVQTVKTGQTGQMHRLLRVVHRSFCWFCHATAHISRFAARSNYSRTSIARTRWWSIWVRTDPAVFEMEYDVACLNSNSPILTTEESNNWPKLKYLLGRFFCAVWNKWIFRKKKGFLIAYAITFSKLCSFIRFTPLSFTEALLQWCINWLLRHTGNTELSVI